MDDRFVQSTSKHSKGKVQATARKKFHTSTPYERQPCKSKTNCGYENIPSENNTEVLSLLKIIIKKQDSLEKRIGQIENSVFNTESVILKDIIQRSQAMVQNKNTRERRIMVKKFHAGGRMSGEIEDVTVDEIASRFPLVTMDALLEVEEKLNMKQYNKSMVAYIDKLKDLCNSVDGVLRRIFTDTLMQSFNWDGRWGKKALNTLKIINQVLFETFQADGKTFELNVKKYVELSRNRMKQKIRLQTKNKKRQELLGYP
ncbi:uncharacterized protein [Bactrocera oleae]|uniref:uncharacterized protein n=1 Tax=Bactrocera oleae TaxID=104688 RepID=UPI0006B850AC|nr:uncharacterized protein LOC106619442 [Bactrocera oleae]XP_014092999.1 uncharacterized protein LOC106619442 [Bactrocera oleae]XP_036227244.1 uncharacterized protein LOC106619442 [Bactrocera oleae]XP_036227245.1 uncharacterized protein LOC106619442 [Bactrocera oleae]XP_036227246.1 uncharacterized protein LOC106619442 [Bactrocera oleae]XP_036227247.1 uncharacterized protein LOC106619442 [Bactrocera oleae]XP_036227248.1 uncharacterized protein LOC106619442 [Bactrocera oleae]XP_036227249.1 unc